MANLKIDINLKRYESYISITTNDFKRFGNIEDFEDIEELAYNIAKIKLEHIKLERQMDMDIEIEHSFNIYDGGKYIYNIKETYEHWSNRANNSILVLNEKINEFKTNL